MMVSVSEAKIKLNKLVSSTRSTVITKNGIPKAVIVSYKLYKEFVRSKRAAEDNLAIKKAEEYFEGKRKGVNQKELDQLLENGKNG
jgi:prevent-host-death family protein